MSEIEGDFLESTTFPISRSSYSWLRERDIDLLLCAELHAEGALTRFIAEKVECLNSSFVGAWVSDTDLDGETDLLVAFRATEGWSIALIENKIAAGFQPEQSSRYLKRRERWLAISGVANVATVLLAPANYFTRSGAEIFQVRLSYEEICGALESERDARSMFLSASMEAAIEALNKGYVLIPNEEVSKVWRSIWTVAFAQFPKLSMTKPAEKPGKSTWVYFRDAEGLSTLTKRVLLVYKAERGQADLQFSGTTEEELHKLAGSFLDSDMRIVRASKSASIRIDVPCLDFSVDAAAQESNVQLGLNACERLRMFFLKNLAR
jgi:hypothetical protein